MALYRDVHSRIAVRDRFADDNEYAAELVQVGWMTGESRREVVPKVAGVHHANSCLEYPT